MSKGPSDPLVNRPDGSIQALELAERGLLDAVFIAKPRLRGRGAAR